VKQSILVTGGAGYIGSHVAKALAAGGYLPVVYDNLGHGHREAVKWGPLIVADLEERAALRAAIGEHQIKAVIHLAGFISVGESVRDPAKYFHNNFAAALGLIEEMDAAKVPAVVFSSTAAVYGMPERVPIVEEQALKPINPYGESKLMVERVLDWMGQSRGLRWMALRYFNAAGADHDGETGEDHGPETHLIPLACHAALGHGTALDIYGNDYPTPDGTAIRDYIHVSDLAAAHVRALEHLLKGGESRALNLGTGSGHSVAAVILAVEAASGRKVPANMAPRRAGDPPALVADPSAARRLLGWQPQHTDLADIVTSAWRWHVKRHG
jgi:UDP-arabinose 4-epimerase